MSDKQEISKAVESFKEASIEIRKRVIGNAKKVAKTRQEQTESPNRYYPHIP